VRGRRWTAAGYNKVTDLTRRSQFRNCRIGKFRAGKREEWRAGVLTRRGA
jgi:hypothetical protein